MGLAVLAFIVIFVLVASSGILLAYRSGMAGRLSAAIASEAPGNAWLRRLKQRGAGESIKAIVQPFEKVLPKSPQEVSVAQQRLIRAGYRQDSHLRIFYGSKVLVPIGFILVVAFGGVTQYFTPFIAYVMAVGFGYLAPDFWLGRQIKKRQTEIRLGLPDFLDLMVVCIEAGLGLDEALARTARELESTHPEVSDEFGLVALEQRAGRPRVDAWRHLADRVDIEMIRTLTASLIQADQFGTSISKTLRTYADGLRVRRRQDVEEQAAKTAVKLIFPLAFFILPTLFIVALGPSLLVMQDAVEKYLK